MHVNYIKAESSRNYYKSTSLLDSLKSFDPDLNVHHRPSRKGRSALKFAIVLVRWYWNLRPIFIDLQGQKVVWLDEFLFNPIDVMLAWLASLRTGSVLVSGPHVLRNDHVYFVSPNAAQGTSNSFVLRKLWNRLLDEMSFLPLDYFQSYSRSLAQRAISSYLMCPQTYIYCPIGLPAELSSFRLWKQPTDFDPLEITFWGVAGPFHGIDLLADVALKLRLKKLRARFTCYTPDTETVRLMLKRAEENGVADMFKVSNVQVAATGYEQVLNSHAAISHLIQGSTSPDAKAALSAVYSNKMLEILAMGMPLIVANTPATREIVDDESALLVEPGSVDSVVEAITMLTHHRQRIAQMSQNGQLRALDRLSAATLGASMKAELALAISKSRA